MFSHSDIWLAIDSLAQSHGYSTSGLARKAGLDPTAFNKSKRISPEGKPRWPSTESIAKILSITGSTMGEFTAMIEALGDTYNRNHGPAIPVIGYAQAGAEGFFDDAGYPAGAGWDEVTLPNFHPNDQQAYALEISGESMLPLYRDGDTIVVSPDSDIRKGDRVVLKTVDGEVMAKELVRQTNTRIEVKSLNPAHEDRIFLPCDVLWVARVLWVSQ